MSDTPIPERRPDDRDIDTPERQNPPRPVTEADQAREEARDRATPEGHETR